MNQQGYDETCGARTVVEPLMEDGIIPLDKDVELALVGELWDQVNPGVSWFANGMTLEDQRYLILYAANKYGKECDIESLSASSIRTSDKVHMTAAVWLENLLGIDSNHFIIRRKDDIDSAGDGKWEILDSCHNIDGDPDVFTIDQIIGAGEDIFGHGNQFGWAWNWN